MLPTPALDLLGISDVRAPADSAPARLLGLPSKSEIAWWPAAQQKPLGPLRVSRGHWGPAGSQQDTPGRCGLEQERVMAQRSPLCLPSPLHLETLPEVWGQAGRSATAGHSDRQEEKSCRWLVVSSYL